MKPYISFIFQVIITYCLLDGAIHYLKLYSSNKKITTLLISIVFVMGFILNLTDTWSAISWFFSKNILSIAQHIDHQA